MGYDWWGQIPAQQTRFVWISKWVFCFCSWFLFDLTGVFFQGWRIESTHLDKHWDSWNWSFEPEVWTKDMNIIEQRELIGSYFPLVYRVFYISGKPSTVRTIDDIKRSSSDPIWPHLWVQERLLAKQMGIVIHTVYLGWPQGYPKALSVPYTASSMCWREGWRMCCWIRLKSKQTWPYGCFQK